ncbi:hypothetical protein [Terrisporobacter glycolicus]|uniref:Uncharacterized protein n=1 Tax=Terrisporobacter glycolicus ATCC 14880 = DSM 1288 TaxID=1121315 RepID=A0ABZ2ESD2_9FIRM|nr:hypothetical protein [Terrisporobacter glycolicus]
MRRKYTKPSMSIDMFEANEYIAACYKIYCNVPTGYGFNDRNGDGKYNKKDDGSKIASGRGCNKVHVGVHLDEAPHENAMWQPTDFWGDDKGQAYGVFNWTQGNGNSGQHFSKVSDTQWETNPNAS